MVVPPKHPKMIILLGKPMVGGYHHFRKPPFRAKQFQNMFISSLKMGSFGKVVWCFSHINSWKLVRKFGVSTHVFWYHTFDLVFFHVFSLSLSGQGYDPIWVLRIFWWWLVYGWLPSCSKPPLSLLLIHFSHTSRTRMACIPSALVPAERRTGLNDCGEWEGHGHVPRNVSPPRLLHMKVWWR